MGLESALEKLARAPYASAADYAECEELHRRFGTTYYFASRFFPAKTRRRTHALYGFVRLPDEWVDNPDCSRDEARSRLNDYRRQLIEAVRGTQPTYPVLRAFADVVLECGIPLEEPLEFLRSMEQDLDQSRYETMEDLRAYMRGSACSVGVMMCYVLCDPLDPTALRHAMALGEAMQMTNFLRDIGEDAGRGRIYLPLDHLALFQVCEYAILEGRANSIFKEMMRFEIAETRKLYRQADGGIDLLPPFARKPVRLASRLYERILDRIEQADYEIFSVRARTSKMEKLAAAVQVLFLNR